MAAVKAGAAKGRPAGRGRIDKREAILEAAFTVFARLGYAQACVQDIATEAGVAKPTVYNHMADKATLFREAMAAAAEKAMADNQAALRRLQVSGAGVRKPLEDVGRHLVHCYCGERSRAVRRLLYAEGGNFPDLLDLVRGGGAAEITALLAGRLARLSVQGHLRIGDPDLAAEQFIALLTGPLEARSAAGTRSVPQRQQDAVVRAAVDTFLAAFGPA